MRPLSPKHHQQAIGLISTTRKLTGVGILFFVMFSLWQFFGDGSFLRTSVLPGASDSIRSLSKLSSTTFEFSIPQPGQLRLSSLPSANAGDATILAVVISSAEGALGSWTVPSPLEIIVNRPPAQLGQDAELILRFPSGYLLSTAKTLATLNFQTTTAGSLQVKRIFLGNTAGQELPPSLNYSIFTDSFQTIQFDETGKQISLTAPEAPPTTPTPTTPFPTPPVVAPPVLQLDLPESFRRPNNTFELPSAQRGLQYFFQVLGKGGVGQKRFSLQGLIPGSDGSFFHSGSGLRFSPKPAQSALDVGGEPSLLIPGNYRIPVMLRDDATTISFTISIAVHDEFGRPVGVGVTQSFSGSTHQCQLGQVCEAFFRARGGVPPYQITFSGEQPQEIPVGSPFLLRGTEESFYRFIPAQVGRSTYTITVTDAEQRTGASDFVLEVIQAPANSTFRFSAEVNCNFLDLSEADNAYDAFQFTCRNGVMSGFEGNIRAKDSLNRAEAAKITSLIVSSQTEVDTFFAPFELESPSTSVNYNDVTVGDWYARFVYFLFRKGIIIDNTLYRPGDILNTAEAMKLIFESYADLNTELAADLAAASGLEWFDSYRIIAQQLDAGIGYANPGGPALREWIADLLFKLHREYPVGKFK